MSVAAHKPVGKTAVEDSRSAARLLVLARVLVAPLLIVAVWATVGSAADVDGATGAIFPVLAGAAVVVAIGGAAWGAGVVAERAVLRRRASERSSD